MAGTSLGSLFAIERTFLGEHPIYDADLAAIQACDREIKQLQINTLELSQTRTFSYKMPAQILACTKEMLKIELARARAFLELYQSGKSPHISANVIPLLESSYAKYEDRIQQFRLIGVIMLGYLGNEYRALKEARLLPEETQEELNRDGEDQKKLIDHVIKLLTAFDEAYQLGNQLRGQLIPKAEPTPPPVRDLLLQQLPEGRDRRDFYLWVVSDQQLTGTSTEIARAGKQYCFQHPKEIQQLIAEYQQED